MHTEIVVNFSCRIDAETGKQVSTDDTIRRAMDELEKFLSNTDTTKDAAVREELKSKLRELLSEDIEDSNKEWFKYGFHIGHLHSYNEFLKGKVPKKLRRNLNRRFSEPDLKVTSFTVDSTAYDVKNPPKQKREAFLKNAALTAPTNTAPTKVEGIVESSISIKSQTEIVHVTRKGIKV